MTNNNIYTHPHFIDNKYNTLYFKIINNAKNRSDISGYTEKHHIIPRSMGGDNSKSNIVALTGREHFICHYLLTKFTSDGGRKSMYYAFSMLKPSNKHKNRYFNSRLYSASKIIFSQINSETHKNKKVSDETREKQREAKLGIKLSDETRGKISKTSKGSNNGMAKTWELTSPDQTVHIVSGNLEKFCCDKNILRVALMKNLGKAVPEISSKFRDKGNKQYRINTIGWKLVEYS